MSSHHRHRQHHHHHPGWWWHRWHLNPLARYATARLHRRVFIWFSVSILLTALTFVGLSWLTGGGVAAWRMKVEGAGALIAAPFGERWGDPARRSEWGALVASRLQVSLRLVDGHGAVLESFGDPRGQPLLVQPVHGPAGPVGAVEVYPGGGGSLARWQVALPFLFALVLLWAIAGRLSFRLTRPLMEVTRMAQALGAGQLSRRMHPPRHGGFEARVLAVALNDMADRIEKQLRDQRELLAAVSHELRTPLSRIRILTELARTGPSRVTPLDELDREVVEMDSLVGELLARSRLDFTALSRRSLDAADLAQRALERAALEPSLLVVEGTRVPFEADATLVLRALANLVENARRHGGRVVFLRVRFAPPVVGFEVDDAGPGFSPGELGRMFQSFSRGASSAEGDSTGLGLGLALVRRIAEAHGGRVYAENREEGGARVGLELPVEVPPPGRAP